MEHTIDTCLDSSFERYRRPHRVNELKRHRGLYWYLCFADDIDEVCATVNSGLQE